MINPRQRKPLTDRTLDLLLDETPDTSAGGRDRGRQVKIETSARYKRTTGTRYKLTQPPGTSLPKLPGTSWPHSRLVQVYRSCQVQVDHTAVWYKFSAAARYKMITVARCRGQVDCSRQVPVDRSRQVFCQSYLFNSFPFPRIWSMWRTTRGSSGRRWLPPTTRKRTTTLKTIHRTIKVTKGLSGLPSLFIYLSWWLDDNLVIKIWKSLLIVADFFLVYQDAKNCFIRHIFKQKFCISRVSLGSLLSNIFYNNNLIRILRS